MAVTVTGASLSGIYERLNSAPTYHPLDADTFSDWSVEAGDIVTVSRGEEEYASPIHSTRMVWKGSPQVTISSTGNKEREAVSKVSRKKYGRGSAAMRNSEDIHHAIYSEDGYLYTLIDVTASSIRTEVGQTISGMAHSIIEQTATYIRTEVENAASSISASVIEQTAEYVRTEVSAVASGVAWSVVEQTMTGIIQEIGRKARVFVQWEDPALDHEDLMDGDIWYKRPSNTSWNAVSGKKWNELGDYAWKSLYGTVHYVRKNGAWIQVSDSATILESKVRVEQDDEHWAVLANQLDANQQAYQSNLTVTAQRINTDVSAARSQLYSTIYSTATNIVHKVEDVESGLQSNIEQTATQIRSYVADEVNDLNSSITQTASQIRLEVNAAKSTLYSSITQTASQIRAEVVDVENELSSSITQTASQIRSEVNAAKSSIWSSITQTSTQIALKVGKGEVISSINQTAESITISAAKVNLDGYVKASDITVNYLAAKFANSSVLSTNYIFSKSLEVGTGTFTINGYACALENGIHSLQITSSGNTYTLQGKHFYSSDWYTIGSFSRATSLSGSWSGSVAGGKSYHVTASPQGNDWYSPSLDQIYYTAASKTWANDKKSFTQLIRVCDDQGEDLYEETLTFDTETSYNTGYDTGGATAYVYPTVYTQNRSGYTVDSEVTIPAGETRYIVGVFTNRSGNAQWGAAKSMKVTAGTSSHSPTIDQVWTSSGIPSGATLLNSLKTQYENAKEDSDNFCIRVKCGSKTKTYYCSP